MPVVAPAGAFPSAPPPSPPSPRLQGLPGARLGDGIPRGLLQLVPAGSAGAAVSAGIPAAEVVVIGGVVIAAVGSGVLVCATASAATDGEATPIDIADQYYGTHFSDVLGWAQGQYPPNSKTEHERDNKRRWGRIYATYTKLNQTTGHYYSGRTSMIVDLAQNPLLQATLAVALRDKNHHLDESPEPRTAEFTFARLDKFDVGNAVDYNQRHNDIAYWRIRGREQQLIDSHGGAWSDTGKPYQTGNAVRGVAKDNPNGRRFHYAAVDFWKELHPYTGY